MRKFKLREAKASGPRSHRKKKKKAAKLGFEFSSIWYYTMILNLSLCQAPFRITMNRPTEIKWFLSWLLITGIAQHYRAGEPPRRKDTSQKCTKLPIWSQGKILAKLQPPHNWLKRTRKAQHNPSHKIFNSSSSHESLPYIATHCEAALPHKTLFHLQ